MLSYVCYVYIIYIYESYTFSTAPRYPFESHVGPSNIHLAGSAKNPALPSPLKKASEDAMCIYMDVSLNGGFSPQIIHFNRVFHYVHHPFWGTPILGNPHIYVSYI